MTRILLLSSSTIPSEALCSSLQYAAMHPITLDHLGEPLVGLIPWHFRLARQLSKKRCTQCSRPYSQSWRKDS